MRSAVVILCLLLPLSPVRAGDDPLDRFLVGSRSSEDGRRREALESLLADPGMVPEDRVGRVVRVLTHVLTEDREPDLRGLAARALAFYRSTETELRIVQQLLAESDHRAERPMIRALAGTEDETVVGYLVKRAYSEVRPDVKALAVEALGMSPSPGAREELIRLAGLALPWPALQAAAHVLSRHPAKETVDRLIDLLWSAEPGVRAVAYRSLVRLTGQRKLSDDPEKWAAWWGDNRETFGFPGGRPRGDEEVKSVVVDPITLPTYYDVPIRGRRTVFCLDISASMWGPKIEAAKAELARAVTSLPCGHEFAVIFFNQRPFPWRRELTPAWPVQKLACVTDFDTLTTKMYTNIFDTLEMALGFAGLGRYALPDPPGVDDVFLVTDGVPNRGRRRDRDGILAGLEEIDPSRRVKIHTISVGDEPEDLMRAIAGARGGSHVHIPAAK